MSKTCFHRALLAGAILLAATSAFGQVDIQLRARQLPGWDPRAREGRCQIRMWVDNRAEVRMRGDTIFVRTLEGSRGRDEGSECSQPLPYNSVRSFQLHQTSGRNRVTLMQEPGRMNNYTAIVAIEDRQGGGDNYTFEVTWQADAGTQAAAAPFFDEVRACQDAVRQRFLGQNGRGAYIDFDGFADRREEGRYRGQDRASERSRSQNNGQEMIHGRGNARRANESRNLTYSCVIDTRRNRVLSGLYQLSGDSLRTTGRPDDRRLR
jgi:hypothetical protein